MVKLVKDKKQGSVMDNELGIGDGHYSDGEGDLSDKKDPTM